VTERDRIFLSVTEGGHDLGTNDLDQRKTRSGETMENRETSQRVFPLHRTVGHEPPQCLSVGPGGLSEQGRANRLREFVRENQNAGRQDIILWAQQNGMSGAEVERVYPGMGW
jgi:hypothetical protein